MRLPQSKLKIGQDRRSERTYSDYGYLWHLLGKGVPICGNTNPVGATQDYYFPVTNLHLYNRRQIDLAIRLTDLVESFLCRECVNAGLRSLLQDSSSHGERVRESSGSEVREQSPSDLRADSDVSSVGLPSSSVPFSGAYYQQYVSDMSGLRQASGLNFVAESGSISSPIQPNFVGIRWDDSGTTQNRVRGSGYSRVRNWLGGRN